MPSASIRCHRIQRDVGLWTNRVETEIQHSLINLGLTNMF